MTRPLRIQYPDAWYHIMNRGRHREAIYLDDWDYGEFINLLKETVSMWNVRIAAFCLMTNHYHLLVQTPQGNLDRCMRHINGIYTQRFNRKHHVDGQLFRGRYKSILVEADDYLLQIVRYIHRNPVRSGIVAQPSEYQWSSHRGYFSGSMDWNWLNKEFILGMLDNERTRQMSTYLDFMGQGDSDDIRKFYEKKNLPSILGKEGFLEQIKNQYAGMKLRHEIPQSQVECLEPTVQEIKEIVGDVYQIASENLLKMRRGFYNEARNVAVYLARLHTGKTLAEIGAAFNIAKYSSVSSIIVNVRDQLKVDEDLAKRVKSIEEIIKGQGQT